MPVAPEMFVVDFNSLGNVTKSVSRYDENGFGSLHIESGIEKEFGPLVRKPSDQAGRPHRMCENQGLLARGASFGAIPSRARFSFNTFTPGSPPIKPSSGPSVALATSARTASS